MVFEALGSQVEYLNMYLFLTLAGNCKLNDLTYFIIWDYLRLPEQREVLEVINNIVHTSDKLVYIGA